MSDYREDLREAMTGSPGEDAEARRAAEILTRAQQILTRMKRDAAFAGAVRPHLAELKTAAASAMRAAGRDTEE